MAGRPSELLGGRLSDGRPSFTGSVGENDQSLGIINLDQVGGLSGSILGFDGAEDSPQEFRKSGNLRVDKTSFQGKLNTGDKPSAVPPSQDFDEGPFGIMNAFRAGPPLAGMFGAGYDDPDASVHEIHFGDSELDDFDEEFSDLGDSDQGESDDTITEGSPDEHAQLGSDELGLDDISMPTAADSPEFEDDFARRESQQSVPFVRRPDSFDGQESDEINSQNAMKDHLRLEDNIDESSQPGSFTDLMPNSTQNRLASLYFRPGSSLDDVDGDEIQQPQTKIFDDTSSGSRGSNIFGETKLSLGLASDRSSSIFGKGDVQPHKVSLGMPCDSRRSTTGEDSVVLDDSAYDESDDGVRLAVNRKSSVASESPVYISENGVGVTDLAFHTSFKNLNNPAENPFLKETFSQDFGSIGDDSFKPAGDMLQMLDKDEKQFEKDNIFMQDAMMNTFSQSHDTFGGFHSNPFSHPPTPDPTASYMRISIGQFIEERTAALGALDGNTDTRPYFGSKIVTPPDNRRPVVLFDKTSPHESGDTKSKRIPPISEEIRGSGVGSDVDLGSFDHGDGADDVKTSPQVRDRTLTTDDLTGPTEEDRTITQNLSANLVATTSDLLESTHEERNSSPDGSSSDQSLGGSSVRQAKLLSCPTEADISQVQGKYEQVNRDKYSGDFNGEDFQAHDERRVSDVRNATADSSILNQSTPVVNLSAIRNIITADSGKPEELVDYVYRMSQAKSKGKYRQSSRERRKAAMEAKGASSDSSDVEEAGRKCKGSRASGTSNMPVSVPERKPADGFSEHQDVGLLGTGAPSLLGTGAPNTQTHGSSDETLPERHNSSRQSQEFCGSSGGLQKKASVKCPSDSIGDKSNKKNSMGVSRTSDGGLPQAGVGRGSRGSVSSTQDKRRDSGNSTTSVREDRRSSVTSVSSNTSKRRASNCSVTSVRSQKSSSARDDNLEESQRSGRHGSSNSTRRDSASSGESRGLARRGSSNSLSGSKIPVMRRASQDDINVCERKTLESDSVAKGAQVSGAKVPEPSKEAEKQLLDDAVKLKPSEAMKMEKCEKQSDIDTPGEEKFDYEISDAHFASDSRWKAMRPSSVLSRSQRINKDPEPQSEVLHPEGSTPLEQGSTPIRKKTSAPRRVQFQQGSRPLNIQASIPETESDSDFHTPDNVQDGKSQPATKAAKTWFSSTPKIPQAQLDMYQEGISKIAGSAQDSFFQNYTDGTLFNSEEKSNAGSIPHRAMPAKSNVDDFIQNSGSYRPMRTSQNTLSCGDPTLLTSQSLAGTVTMASQYLDSHLQASGTAMKWQQSQGESQAKYDGVFKVPLKPPPHRTKSPFDDRPSLPFAASIGPVNEFMFRTSLSPQQQMDESRSLSRLSNNRESIPGLPANQSTPFNNSSRSSLEPKSPQMAPAVQTTGQIPARGSINGDAKQHAATWGGFGQSVISVDAPSEISIPSTCCVGLTTKTNIPLKNSSSHWIGVNIRVVSLSVNGRDQDLTANVPFVYKEMAIVEPHTVENVRVAFVPRESGAYMVQLHLMANPLTDDHSQAAPSLPITVTIAAQAETPTVQVLCDANRGLLDYGSLPWGCQKGLPVTLINPGRASLPLRLSIANYSPWHGFTFDKGDISDISERSGDDHLSEAVVMENIVLPGAETDSDVQPVQILVYFKAPKRQIDRALCMWPPEEFQARLDMEVDMPPGSSTMSAASLSSVTLMATVGIARLHIPVDIDKIMMKTHLGQTAMKRVPLRNAGNITLEVSLEVTHWPDFFTIVPMQLMIEAGGQSEFIIKFDPKQSTARDFESLLLMVVEPDGPGFEIDLFGEILPQPSLDPYPRYPSKAVQLLSNKRYLAWGGVALGDSSSLTLTLKNAADVMMKVQLEILNSSEFKILTVYGHKEKLSASKEIPLKPLEEYPVHIRFLPSQVTAFKGKLQIKKLNSSFKCAIPLSGFGGTSDVTLDQVKHNGPNSSWISMGTPVSGNKMAASIKVSNQGQRPAYVTALCFEDLSCKKKLGEGRQVFIQPREFCLAPNKSQDVLIQTLPSDREVAVCRHQSGIMAVVCFFHGDHLSKQLYRLALHKPDRSAKPVQLPDNNLVRDVNFDLDYYNEHLLPGGIDMKSTASDVELFYSSMQRTSLALVGIPDIPDTNKQNTPTHSYSSGQTESLREKAIQRERPAENSESCADQLKSGWQKVEATSPPVRDVKQARNASNIRQELHPADISPTGRTNASTDIEWWTLEPKQLILMAEARGEVPAIKKVQITNYTDSSTRFELLWPGHYVCVTPEEGIIPPKSFTLVCLSASPNLSQRVSQLPWSGKVHVNCNGQTKVLQIQVHNDPLSQDSMDTRPKQTRPTDHVKPLIAVSTSSNHEPPDLLRVTQQKVEFTVTKVCQLAEQHVELRNICAQTIHWTITSFAPAYLKPPEADSSVFRVTYSVFRLPKITGLLEPHQSVQLPVNFIPRERGWYSQYWEIQSVIVGDDAATDSSHTCKLELQGQCIHKDVSIPVEKTLLSKETSRSSSIKCREGVVTLLPESVNFSVQSSGATEWKKIRVGNKSKELVQVEVLQLKSPFRVKETKLQIKPRHYLSLPVEFRPKHAGYFQETLVVRKLSGEVLKMGVTGVCNN